MCSCTPTSTRLRYCRCSTPRPAYGRSRPKGRSASTRSNETSRRDRSERSLTIAARRIVRRIQRVRPRGLLARWIKYRDPGIHEQHFVRPGREWRKGGVARVVIGVEMGHDEMASELFRGGQVERVVSAVKLDRELVNTVEHRVRRREQRLPFGPLDVH